MAPLSAERDQRATPAPLRGRLGLAAEDLAWLGAVAAAILLAGAFVLITGRLATLYPSPKTDVFAVWRPLIQPEPREEVRSILALAAPFAVAALVLALGGRRPERRSLDPLIVGAQALAGGLLVWAVLEQPRESGFLLTYFKPYLLSAPNLIAGVVIGLALTGVILRWRRAVPVALSRAAERIRGSGATAFAVALTVTVVFLLLGRQRPHPPRRLHRAVREPAAPRARADPGALSLLDHLVLDRDVRALDSRAPRGLRRLPRDDPQLVVGARPLSAVPRPCTLPVARRRALPELRRHLLRRPAGPLHRPADPGLAVRALRAAADPALGAVRAGRAGPDQQR